jgi:CheY-like chemotaxis protein
MKYHILFINESKDELNLFQEALKKLPDGEHFKCTYADSPWEALEMLMHLAPDFIFFDMNMDDMDGLEFLSLIKKSPHLQRTKAWLYSSEISEETYSQLMSAGAAGWIEKTDSIDRLVIKLKIFIEIDSPPALR